MKLVAAVALAVTVAATAAACSETRASTRPDALARLHEVMDDLITSDAQDDEMWALTRQVAGERRLIGWTRAQVVAALGDGFVCNPGIYACPDGVGGGDLVYWIGRLPRALDGGTPVLLVDLESDRVVGVRAVHTQ